MASVEETMMKLAKRIAEVGGPIDDDRYGRDADRFGIGLDDESIKTIMDGADFEFDELMMVADKSVTIMLLGVINAEVLITKAAEGLFFQAFMTGYLHAKENS
jgi:hypothetical protein